MVRPAVSAWQASYIKNRWAGGRDLGGARVIRD